MTPLAQGASDTYPANDKRPHTNPQQAPYLLRPQTGTDLTTED